MSEQIKAEMAKAKVSHCFNRHSRSAMTWEAGFEVAYLIMNRHLANRDAEILLLKDFIESCEDVLDVKSKEITRLKAALAKCKSHRNLCIKQLGAMAEDSELVDEGILLADAELEKILGDLRL